MRKLLAYAISRQRLDTDKYDLSFEMNTPSDGWWEDNVLPDLLSEDEASAQHCATLELISSLLLFQALAQAKESLWLLFT